MSLPSDTRCENCRFWKPISAAPLPEGEDTGTDAEAEAEDTAEEGHCRRFPATVLQRDGEPVGSAFPLLDADDWCGEFQMAEGV